MESIKDAKKYIANHEKFNDRTLLIICFQYNWFINILVQ